MGNHCIKYGKQSKDIEQTIVGLQTNGQTNDRPLGSKQHAPSFQRSIVRRLNSPTAQ